MLTHIEGEVLELAAESDTRCGILDTVLHARQRCYARPRFPQGSRNGILVLFRRSRIPRQLAIRLRGLNEGANDRPRVKNIMVTITVRCITSRPGVNDFEPRRIVQPQAVTPTDWDSTTRSEVFVEATGEL